MDAKTVILGLLTRGAMTGYDIKKHMEECFRHFFRAGYGSIYPALAELARQDLVSVEAVSRPGKPARKVYAITEAGRAELGAVLGRTEPQHRVRSEFLVLLYFADLLPRERVRAVIDQMTAQWEQLLRDDLALIERLHDGTHGTTPGLRFALGYGRNVVRAALDYVGREREGLMAELAADQAALARAAE